MPKKETINIEYRGYTWLLPSGRQGGGSTYIPSATDYCIRIPIMSQDLRRRRR